MLEYPPTTVLLLVLVTCSTMSLAAPAPVAFFGNVVSSSDPSSSSFLNKTESPLPKTEMPAVFNQPSSSIAVGLGVGGVAILMLLIGLYWWYRKWKVDRKKASSVRRKNSGRSGGESSGSKDQTVPGGRSRWPQISPIKVPKLAAEAPYKRYSDPPDSSISIDVSASTLLLPPFARESIETSLTASPPAAGSNLSRQKAGPSNRLSLEIDPQNTPEDYTGSTLRISPTAKRFPLELPDNEFPQSYQSRMTILDTISPPHFENSNRLSAATILNTIPRDNLLTETISDHRQSIATVLNTLPRSDIDSPLHGHLPPSFYESDTISSSQSLEYSTSPRQTPISQKPLLKRVLTQEASKNSLNVVSSPLSMLSPAESMSTWSEVSVRSSTTDSSLSEYLDDWDDAGRCLVSNM